MGQLSKQVLRTVSHLVLGKHPNNTIFSFNYHNIRHINRFLRQSVNVFEKKSDYVLADIGGGKNPYFEIFLPFLKQYISVDLKESLVENETREILQLEGVAENVPLENTSADIVLSNQVLEHVIDPMKTVEEAFRVLKSGGYFIGSVPHISPVHLEPYDFRRYTDLGLKQLLENAGFEVVQLEGNGGVYSAVAFTLAMDWVLSKRKSGQGQRVNGIKSLVLSPLVGFVNFLGLTGDLIFGNKNRSASNLCFIAIKK